MSRPTDVKSRFYSPTSSKLLFGIFESLDCNFAPPSFRCLSPLADVDRVLVVVGVVVVCYVEVVDVVVVVVIVVIVIVEVTERGEKRLAWKLFALRMLACLALYSSPRPLGRRVAEQEIRFLDCLTHPNIRLLVPTCWHY